MPTTLAPEPSVVTVEAVRLWCAEFELATRHISEAAANDDVMRILGRMSGCDIPGWAVAVAG